MLAPKERDLWQILPAGVESDADIAVYAEVTGDASVSTAALAMFRLSRALFEIAEYVSWLVAPHEDTEDTPIGWKGLVGYLRFDS